MRAPTGPPEAVEALEERLATLPGVGKVTARRLTYHLLGVPREEALSVAKALVRAREETCRCSQCGNLGSQDPCWICADPHRDRSRVCVVEDPRDLLALESAGVFSGLYHLLPARLSPVHGQGPEALESGRLLGRLGKMEVGEVILATNPDQEGEATAHYLADLLVKEGYTVTRIARGIPAGSSIEQVAGTILSDALKGRHPLQ